MTQAQVQTETLDELQQTQNEATAPPNSKVTPPRRLEPSEVGWQFVQEYYTMLNKDPIRLHRFYSNESSMLHGTEGETVPICRGQHDIHLRFKSLNLKNSKVVISNVDSQASLNGGILVCVLGELENSGYPCRKFSQSFFLAEQPNGFFVLNDVLRFLKEEYEEEVANGNYEVSRSTDYEQMEAVPADLAKESSTEVRNLPVAEDTFVQAAIPVASQTEANESHVQPVQEASSAIEANEVTASSIEPVKPVLAAESSAASSEIQPKQKKGKEGKASKEGKQQVLVENNDDDKTAQQKPNAPKTWAALAAKPGDSVKIPTEVKIPVAVVSVQSPSPEIKTKTNSTQNHQGNHYVRNSFYISGFTKATKLSQIKEAFTNELGPLQWVDLITEGSAWITYDAQEPVKKALDMKKIVVNGETVLIEDKQKPKDFQRRTTGQVPLQQTQYNQQSRRQGGYQQKSNSNTNMNNTRPSNASFSSKKQ